MFLTAPTICEACDMLTHASQILLSQWHPSYLMTTAICEGVGGLLSNLCGERNVPPQEALK